jgi:hypothetical protein
MNYLYVLCITHDVDLGTMCDSHCVYLRVLWTICMYKFSRCYTIFHGFFFPMIEFFGK